MGFLAPTTWGQYLGVGQVLDRPDARQEKRYGHRAPTTDVARHVPAANRDADGARRAIVYKRAHGTADSSDRER